MPGSGDLRGLYASQMSQPALSFKGRSLIAAKPWPARPEQRAPFERPGLPRVSTAPASIGSRPPQRWTSVLSPSRNHYRMDNVSDPAPSRMSARSQPRSSDSFTRSEPASPGQALRRPNSARYKNVRNLSCTSSASPAPRSEPSGTGSTASTATKSSSQKNPSPVYSLCLTVSYGEGLAVRNPGLEGLELASDRHHAFREPRLRTKRSCSINDATCDYGYLGASHGMLRTERASTGTPDKPQPNDTDRHDVVRHKTSIDSGYWSDDNAHPGPRGPLTVVNEGITGEDSATGAAQVRFSI